MTDKLEINVISIDGKKYHDFIEAIYIDVPNSGVMGILPNRIPFVSLLYVGNFYIVKNNIKYYFAYSGGVINYKNSKVTILCDTFEKDDEIDKERVLKAKEKAEEVLRTIDAPKGAIYDDALFSLLKATSRLKLLKS